MKFQIITNNILVLNEYKNKYDINYFDVSYSEILDKVHFLIEEGYKLLSHPLSGSVKPNETPFKSIMLSKQKEKVDYESLLLIEKSLEAYRKFVKLGIKYNDKVLDDFRYVDYTLISSAIQSVVINF